MPTLIPADVGPDSFASEGERKVFEYFANSRIDGYVLHSLGFEMHGSREIDYVVVCERGILCLEVKGGGIGRENGLWYYVDRNGGRHYDEKGPYIQARENMYKLRDKFKAHFRSGPIREVQFSYGVVLTDAPMSFHGVDIVEELTFDKRMGLDDFDSYITRCYDYSADVCRKLNGMPGALLTNRKDLETVKDYLRGDFGFLPDLNSQLDGLEGRLNKATQEQYRVLEQLQLVKRLIVRGGAGTGKTLIAVEHARRLSCSGHKVLFLTFNKQIMQHLSHVSPIDGVTFDNYSHFLYKALYPNEDYVHEGDFNDFNRRVLPEGFINKGGLAEDLRYDALIVDEAQDILDDNAIICMDMTVKGGLSRGEVAIFYDPNQNIFNISDTNRLDGAVRTLTEEYGFMPFILTENCRSTRRISSFLAKATGLAPISGGPVEGMKVNLITYENLDQQRQSLAEVIKGLRKEGVPPGDIVVLSHIGNKKEHGCFFDLTALNGLCSYQFVDGREYQPPVKDRLRVTTVQSFKGMESKVVIVADVKGLDDGNGFIKPLNYTSFSRAKTQLFILAHKDAKKELSKVINEVG